MTTTRSVGDEVASQAWMGAMGEAKRRKVAPNQDRGWLQLAVVDHWGVVAGRGFRGADVAGVIRDYDRTDPLRGTGIVQDELVAAREIALRETCRGMRRHDGAVDPDGTTPPVWRNLLWMASNHHPENRVAIDEALNRGETVHLTFFPEGDVVEIYVSDAPLGLTDGPTRITGAPTAPDDVMPAIRSMLGRARVDA